MVQEALAIGPVMLRAPVALLLALGGVAGVALAANLFGHAVLVAPPPTVVAGLLRGNLANLFLSVLVPGLAALVGLAAASGQESRHHNRREGIALFRKPHAILPSLPSNTLGHRPRLRCGRLVPVLLAGRLEHHVEHSQHQQR